MKIRLKHNIPVATEHGMEGGRVFEVVRIRGDEDTSPAYWFVRGDTGEEVGIMFREAEVVKEGKTLDEEIDNVGWI